MTAITTTQEQTTEDRSRWIALVVLCVGMLMIVLDATIVNVALPSIQDDLDFSQSNLAWIVGRATFTIVWSRMIINIPAHRTTRASQRESRVRVVIGLPPES